MTGETSTLLQHRWKNLLTWLEGHGFQPQSLPVDCRDMAYAGKGLFARTDCMPGSLLFEIPPKALMNKMTLKQLYPPNARVIKALTAVQFISMHLFMWRPNANEDSADPFFGPYISVLPRDFDSHPLTWLVLSKFSKADHLRVSLLNSLPSSVLVAVHRLDARFWEDWCKVRIFLKKVPSIVAATTRVRLNNLEELDAVLDFLWAWLNVNTRCIYYRLKHARTDPDNLTMCPILDFANHTPGQANMISMPSNAGLCNVAPVNYIGDGLKFSSPGNVKIEENDEILLTYGLHSNKTLFVEYGFVNSFSENGPSPSGEADVQELVEEHVLTDVRFAEAVKVALIAERYWGDWTLYSTPDGAQPSWRLITALRLYHFVTATGAVDEDTIQIWRDVVMGVRLRVSFENEQSWRKTVVRLCDMLKERAEKAISAVGSASNTKGEVDWIMWMLENILSLWKEELFVARAVKESILRGDEY